jgi:hypothetical protein
MIFPARQKRFEEMKKASPAFWEPVPIPVILMEK